MSNAAGVNNIKLINGEVDKVMRLDETPYVDSSGVPIFKKIWKLMLANTWFVEEVNVGKDLLDWKTKMSKDEQRAFKMALAFASNLDGIQTTNLPENIVPFITENWARMCANRQTFEEALHVESYLEIVDSLELDRNEVYNMFKTDSILNKKNQHIIDVYEELAKEPTTQGKIKAMFANLALEHIYFYSVFLVFFNFAKLGKMKYSSEMIRFIARDESTSHTAYFVNMIKTARREYPKEFEEVLPYVENMFREAVDLEITWGKHITKNQILGISDRGLEKFIKSLGNKAFSRIGLEPLYKKAETDHPFSWFWDYLNFNATNERFFEQSVKNYSKGNSTHVDFENLRKRLSSF